MSDRYNGKETWEEWSKEWKLEDRYNFKTIEKNGRTSGTRKKHIRWNPIPTRRNFMPWSNFPTRPAPTSCRTSALIHRFGRYFPQEKNAGF